MTSPTNSAAVLTPAHKAALKTLRAYATGRSAADFREHSSGMTLVFTSRYAATIARIKDAVAVLGGEVYSVRTNMRSNGTQVAARHTTIEWCVSPSADTYCLTGGKLAAVTL